MPEADTAVPEVITSPPFNNVPLSDGLKEIVMDWSVHPEAAVMESVALSFAYKRQVPGDAE